MKFKNFTKALFVGMGFFALLNALKTQAKDKLQIKILDGNGAQIDRVYIHPKDSTIHIFGSGQRYKSLPMSIGSHVDMQLINSNGDVVKEMTQLILLTPPRWDVWRTHRFTYIVNASSETLTQASLVQVIYRPYPHGDCSKL